MAINIVVILFIGVHAYWFSIQGLFSAAMHLLILIIAGSLAFAVWEPLTVGLLLDLLPEHAWGIGLLLPLAVLLILLRIAADKLVPGNVRYENLTSMLAGGAAGAVSGILTVGLLVIALPMAGVPEFGIPDLAGYQPYRPGPNGAPERANRLRLPADDMAAAVFTHLSQNSMVPWSRQALSRYHPDLVREAGGFHYAMQADRYGLRAIRDENITVEDVQLIETMPSMDMPEMPDIPEMPETPELPDLTGCAIVATTIHSDTSSFNTLDGRFRAAPHQVKLLCESDDGLVSVFPFMCMPQGPIPVSFEQPGQFVFSAAQVDAATFDWVFRLPEGATPVYLVVKQLRLELPQATVADEQFIKEMQKAFETSMKELQESLQSGDGEADRPIGPTTLDTGEFHIEPIAGAVTGAEPGKGRFSNRLPFGISRNQLNQFGQVRITQDGAWQSGTAKGLQPPPTRAGLSNRVDTIDHESGTQILQVELLKDQADSWLGRAHAAAITKTHKPLVKVDGQNLVAIGWARYVPDSSMTLSIRDPSTGTLTLEQLGIHSMKPDERLILFFQVPSGAIVSTLNLDSIEIGRIDRTP
ncbi:MAG: hypothetical protein CMJ49_12085 [Planctomycetaceae bacterium]|nr:hypothetical protein [Planctomycetaceae bacterium]